RVLTATGNPSVCVSVAPGGNYNLGGWFRNVEALTYTCTWYRFTGPNCTGASAVGQTISGSESAWTHKMIPVHFPSDAVSMRLACDANANTYIDKLSLSLDGF